jgi:hypothetical protein
MWETMMPPVFVETFKNRPLSSWPLLTNTSLPDQLTGDVTIVGYDDHQPKLAISHKNITTQRFMKAHVENNSKQGDQDVPPFYFPAPHVSGPDVIFFVKINGNMYPIFVQVFSSALHVFFSIAFYFGLLYCSNVSFFSFFPFFLFLTAEITTSPRGQRRRKSACNR